MRVPLKNIKSIVSFKAKMCPKENLYTISRSENGLTGSISGLMLQMFLQTVDMLKNWQAPMLMGCKTIF